MGRVGSASPETVMSTHLELDKLTVSSRTPPVYRIVAACWEQCVLRACGKRRPLKLLIFAVSTAWIANLQTALSLGTLCTSAAKEGSETRLAMEHARLGIAGLESWSAAIQ